MRYIFFVIIGIVLSFQQLQAQSLAINTDGSTANASAMVDIKSTNKGLLIPRMTRTERNAIAAPATGLMIFQSGPDSIGYHYYDGSRWSWVVSNSNADTLAWRTRGNTGTNAASHFLGTADNTPLVIKTNGIERLRVTTNNEIGIGTSTPNSSFGSAKLEIASEGTTNADLLLRNAVNSNNYAPGFVIQHARGTLAAPLAVQSGDYVAGGLIMQNYTGTAYSTSATIDVFAEGTVTAAKVPSRIQFGTMSDAGDYNYRLTIKNDGKVGIGKDNPGEKLDVLGNVRFSGALMPDAQPGSSGQVLTSAGPSAPPTWTFNTNELFNNTFVVFSTASINTSTTWQVIPGMSQAITIPAGRTAKVIIQANVGLFTNCATNGGISGTDIAIHRNGSILANGGFRRTYLADALIDLDDNNIYGNPSMQVIETLTAGTYTYDLRCWQQLTGSCNAAVAGAANDIRQGALTLMVIYQ